MPSLNLYLVGGAVRDQLLGLPVKDYDFAVEVQGFDILQGPVALAEAYFFMTDYLRNEGYTIFLEDPKTVTVRAKFPPTHPLARTTADFVLCRKEGPYSDGRHPDYVTLGTLEDDLARRDFTVNAMARPVLQDGSFGDTIDLHRGIQCLETKTLQFIGGAMDRIREDGIRVLRAIRFKITKDFNFHHSIPYILRNSTEAAELLAGTSEDRRREELERCFHHDTLATLDVLQHDISKELRDAIFAGNLRLSATQRTKLNHA